MSVNNSSAVRKPGEAAALGLPSTPSSGSVSHSSMTGPRRWASKLHTAWAAAGQGAAEHRRDGLGRPYSPQPCLQGSPGAHRRGSSHGQRESKGHGGTSAAHSLGIGQCSAQHSPVLLQCCC